MIETGNYCRASSAPLPALYQRPSVRCVQNVEVTLFADDVSVFSRNTNKKVAETAMQEVITKAMGRSKRHKLILNARKCEDAFSD